MSIRISYAFAIMAVLLLTACDKLEETDTAFELDNFYRFETSSSSVAENCPVAIRIPVVYSSGDGSSAAGQVDYSVSGGVEGADFELVSGATLAFNVDNGFTNYVEILPVDNDVFEADITLTIELTNPVGGRVGFEGPDARNGKHNLRILNDDCQNDPFPLSGVFQAQSVGQSTDDCCPDQTTLTSTVSLAPLGGDQYFLNDFSGGLYVEWYDVYGITSQDQSPIVLIFDQCTGSVREQEGASEPFGTAVDLTGTYDKCSGTLTYTWTNGFSDSGTITLTPL